MNRKPHLIRLSDGWWCAGYDGETPFLAYAKWFVSTAMAELSPLWATPEGPCLEVVIE